MSAVNNFRDTTDADILNKLRQDIESAKAGNTSQNNFTLNYISPNADTIDITDSVSINGTGFQTASDTINITDSVSQVNSTAGQFSADGDFIVGNGYMFNDSTTGNFVTGTGGFNEPTQPCRADFSDVG